MIKRGGRGPFHASRTSGKPGDGTGGTITASKFLMEDGTSAILLEDGTSRLLLEA